MDQMLAEVKQEEFIKMPSTPSPSTTPSSSQTSSVLPRRPARKSTLTQQQKNQKRQRATQDQLMTLEAEFNKNPTPTAIVRDRIALEINMTERSVQIWFQNRRAKIKQLAKRSIETGEDCDAIPDSMRHYLAMQAIESGKPLGQHLLGGGGPFSVYGSGGVLLKAESNGSGKVVIEHFTCRSLSIGSWRRIGQTCMDLIIFYSPEKACVTYYINNDSAGYKIEYPFSYIRNITLENGDPSLNAEANGQNTGGLVIELHRPPNFFMDHSGSGGFVQCGDFTEEEQASRVLIHHLGGNPKVLSGQLAKLVSLDSFQSRRSMLEPTAFPTTPVDPINFRPASQPNHISHPQFGMFPDSQFANGFQSARGHKRTRSRSVPVAIDFSMLQPMSSFNFAPTFYTSTPDSVPQMPQSNLYAPIPQHQNNFGSLQENLRIDTSPGFPLEFRPHPMSATTNSPSEYASEAFFANNTQSDSLPATAFSTPYNMPFLSPMVDPSAMSGASMSPLSAMNHGDPIIADHSPPLSMHRSASGGLFSMSHEQSNLSDDGLGLTELYSKQNLNLPLHSPAMDDGMDPLDIHDLVSFGTVDPSSLSPADSLV